MKGVECEANKHQLSLKKKKKTQMRMMPHPVGEYYVCIKIVYAKHDYAIA